METNFEHYKDEFLKLFITNYNGRCNFIRKYILHSTSIECTNISCSECTTKIEKWLDEVYKEPNIEIDWTKVPADTPVYVWDNLDDRKMIKHFASYNPTANINHFLCYIQGKTSWTTKETTHWKYCELVREEDKIKYAKEDKK